MEKVLQKIGKFFKAIWGWIKNTAWVQPLLIVIIIFGVIFSINPIIKGVKNLVGQDQKEGTFYKDHTVYYSNLHTGKKYVENKDCIVVYVDLQDATKKQAAYKLEIYLKNFYKETSGAKVYVVDIGSDNFKEGKIDGEKDDNGKKKIQQVYDELVDLYNIDMQADNEIQNRYTYTITFSEWNVEGSSNEYLKGSENLYINSPTYVKYKNGKASDIRFDLNSYKDDNGKSISPLTILTDLWNGGNIE